MKYGKTIKLFLIDGEPNGRMTCELSNWTGKAYKIPRIKIKDCTDRPDLTNPGVYFLLGKNEFGKELAYIGEAESIFKRLTQHLTQKDFWNDAIVFISKDENLNKAHIKYLEYRLYDLAKTINRYNIENNATPTQSSISESEQAEMEEFIENIKILINTLGHKIFEPKREVKSQVEQEKDTFYIKSSKGADAKGQPTSDGFVVFKDSKVALSIVPSFRDYSINLRNNLIETAVLIKEEENYIFTEDYIFTSSSSAATIVLGRGANGLTEWKLKNGTTLKDFEQKN